MPYTGDPNLHIRKAEGLFVAFATLCMTAVLATGVYSFVKASQTVGGLGASAAPFMGQGVDVSRGTAAVGTSRSGSSPLEERGVVSYGPSAQPRYTPAGGIDITNATRGTGAGPSGCYAKKKGEGAVDIGPSQMKEAIQQINL